MSARQELNLDPEMLEAYITPQFSNSCNGSRLLEKLVEGSCIRFILSTTYMLFVSDATHEEMIRVDGVIPLEQICYGSYYPIRGGKDYCDMQDDINDKKPQTAVLKPIVLKKMRSILTPYRRSSEVLRGGV